MVKKKKDILIDVGSNSGLGYSVGEDAEVANNPAHASTPHYKPGLEKKKDFEHEM